MENHFKEGDVVLCIETGYGSGNPPRKDHHYIVKEFYRGNVVGPMVRLSGVTSLWYAKRFKLISRPKEYIKLKAEHRGKLPLMHHLFGERFPSATTLIEKESPIEIEINLFGLSDLFELAKDSATIIRNSLNVNDIIFELKDHALFANKDDIMLDRRAITSLRRWYHLSPFNGFKNQLCSIGRIHFNRVHIKAIIDFYENNF